MEVTFAKEYSDITLTLLQLHDLSRWIAGTYSVGSRGHPCPQGCVKQPSKYVVVLCTSTNYFLRFLSESVRARVPAIRQEEVPA